MLGFDIESDEYREGLSPADLQVTCAAVCERNADPIFFPAIDDSGIYTNIMSVSGTRALADYLIEYARDGYVVTWNGMHFDFPLLNAVCGSAAYSQEIKRVSMERHIDMGYAMVSDMGFMIGLDKAAKSLGLGGKTEGMHGYLAPLLWHPERELTEEELQEIKPLGVTPGSDQAKELCLQYVGQDAKVTVETYDALVEQGVVSWISGKGNKVKNPWRPSMVDGRLLTVYEACRLTPVSTPWFKDNPFNKDKIVQWAMDYKR
jgi:hypothetical protein